MGVRFKPGCECARPNTTNREQHGVPDHSIAAERFLAALNGTLDDGADGVAGVGDVLTFKVAVTNRGNTCLENLSVRDFIGSFFECTQPLPAGSEHTVSESSRWRVVVPDSSRARCLANRVFLRAATVVTRPVVAVHQR